MNPSTGKDLFKIDEQKKIMQYNKASLQLQINKALVKGNLAEYYFLSGNPSTIDPQKELEFLLTQERTQRQGRNDLTKTLVEEIMGQSDKINKFDVQQRLDGLTQGQLMAIKKAIPNIDAAELEVLIKTNIKDVITNGKLVTKIELENIINKAVITLGGVIPAPGAIIAAVAAAGGAGGAGAGGAGAPTPPLPSTPSSPSILGLRPSPSTPMFGTSIFSPTPRYPTSSSSMTRSRPPLLSLRTTRSRVSTFPSSIRTTGPLPRFNLMGTPTLLKKNNVQNRPNINLAPLPFNLQDDALDTELPEEGIDEESFYSIPSPNTTATLPSPIPIKSSPIPIKSLPLPIPISNKGPILAPIHATVPPRDITSYEKTEQSVQRITDRRNLEEANKQAIERAQNEALLQIEDDRLKLARLGEAQQVGDILISDPDRIENEAFRWIVEDRAAFEELGGNDVMYAEKNKDGKGGQYKRISKTIQDRFLQKLKVERNLPVGLNMREYMKARGSKVGNDGYQELTIADLPKDTSSSSTGYGIKKISFGNFLIDHKKLHKHNILSITYKNGRKVPKLANVEVSDNLKKVLMKKQVTHKLNLTSNEKMFLHKLVSKSDANIGLSKQRAMGDKHSHLAQDLRKELSILIGEVEAGNDSGDILVEIEKVLHKMILIGSITDTTALRIMNSVG